MLTEKVIYVVPTIAMVMMVANTVEIENSTSRNRIDAEDSVIEDEAIQQSSEGSGGGLG